MMIRIARHWATFSLVAVLLTLSACSDPEQTAEVPAAAEQQEAVADAAAEAGAEAAELEAIESVAETEGLAEEAVAEADEIILNETEAAADVAAVQQDWQYKEGVDFRRLTTSQGTSSAPDKIEVAEVFWYGCPHCYNFDPIISEWKKSLPADVSFVQIPVIWNPTNQVHARLLYTAEALGVLDDVHLAIFRSIHQDGNMLTSEDDMVALFSKYGVDEATFREAYQSFGVTSAVKRAENLTRRYGIRSVPVLVVNGKYVTDGEGVRTFDDMLSVATELTERERSGQ
jgi:thiol:disulfide interchange protein DsbA